MDWADETRMVAKEKAVRIANWRERLAAMLNATIALPSRSVTLGPRSRIVLASATGTVFRFLERLSGLNYAWQVPLVSPSKCSVSDNTPPLFRREFAKLVKVGVEGGVTSALTNIANPRGIRHSTGPSGERFQDSTIGIRVAFQGEGCIHEMDRSEGLVYRKWSAARDQCNRKEHPALSSTGGNEE